ncbi:MULTISPECIES: substrate-binding domain-containing protein [Nostoc]|uniref:Substrate-binding domain-containing protein n=1 Tax=Nostoc paludosum FACHB-159 TaxID=2692908 RepID=A0ABR8KFZ5_9NOSO|nr:MULTISPECIES: substrate-binding domain-containing protein [Nostoc]MBD2681292.1 substrate-binding domain-containing protein [Nostoc sp. FACHB-857]MBD2737771.1 substrate-binding domain-containing protein [Nostoc paludosum FACHB-159]
MSVTEPVYKEYFCSRNTPLSCDRLEQTLKEFPKAKFCLECGFPALLPEKAEIKGSRGTYQITRFLGSRGMGRLYLGIQLSNNEPVVIKEYLLPNHSFNSEEANQRQDTFTRVAGVSPADGRVQDFRLISPWEAIADPLAQRCYTVTLGNLEASQTLSEYLTQKGAMTAYQVREVLNQALQTLQFLHTQKLRLVSGQIQQGLVHGNLSLNSFLIVPNNQQNSTIYLCDLALWEDLFTPPSIFQRGIINPIQDLEDVGRVAFYLWTGRSQNLNPRDEKQWPDSDPDLKNFIYRLLGIELPFKNAETARQALLQLPQENQALSLTTVITPDGKDKSFRRIIFLLLALFTFLLFGGGIFFFLMRGSAIQDDTGEFYHLVPTFSDVNGVPPGNFIYTSEQNGTWSNILKFRPTSDSSLEDLLTHPKADVNAQFNYQPVSSTNIQTASQSLEELTTGKAQFAITSLVDDVSNNFSDRQVAYDGLLVYVAFSKKDQNLPKALNGQISLEQLRQIYTGEINNWQQLGGPNLPIKPYAPTEPEAVRQFEKIVLKDDPQQIALYQAKVTTQPTEQTQQQIITAFDTGQVGIISYGILSKTWNQCAGYPLALVDGNKPASQVLFRLNGIPISPSDNICDKNNHLDVQTFVSGSYPLAYPLVVVYPKDNSLPPAGSKFADILTTRQGQCLLGKAGVVPLKPIPDKYLISNDCKSLS